jgi:hypothetical protein
MIEEPFAHIRGEIGIEWHFAASGKVHASQHEGAIMLIDEIGIADSDTHIYPRCFLTIIASLFEGGQAR